MRFQTLCIENSLTYFFKRNEITNQHFIFRLISFFSFQCRQDQVIRRLKNLKGAFTHYEIRWENLFFIILNVLFWWTIIDFYIFGNVQIKKNYCIFGNGCSLKEQPINNVISTFLAYSSSAKTVWCIPKLLFFLMFNFYFFPNFKVIQFLQF